MKALWLTALRIHGVLAVVVLLLVEIIKHHLVLSLLLYQINMRVIIIQVKCFVCILELAITTDGIRVVLLAEMVFRVTLNELLIHFLFLLTHLWTLDLSLGRSVKCWLLIKILVHLRL